MARLGGLGRSGGCETGWIGEGSLGGLEFAEGFAHDLLGHAGALAALTSDASGLAYFPVAAAAFVNGFAKLTVGDTLAKANVHEQYPLSLLMVRC